MKKTENKKTDNTDFFDRSNTIKWILRIFYGICIALALLDFVIHRHTETDIEKIPTFYAAYGFVACVILVLIATQMRKVVMRGENYYQDESVVRTNGDDRD